MTPLFSRAGQARLDQIVQPGLLCVFDFDGTLSPIVTHPEQAHLPSGILQRLIELSSHVPVAIITGRSLADIRTRLQFEPDFLVGNHGLEGMPDGAPQAQLYEQTCRVWKALLSTTLEDRTCFDPNIQIEDKRFSLSVHYRLVRDRAQTELRLLELFAGLEPPARVVAGKCVFNLLPEGAPNKGMALEQLMLVSGARSAIYIGDDVTDEDVFRLRRQDLLSVRIERAPDSAADFFLHHRSEVVQMLDELIRRLRKQQIKNAV